VIFPLTVIADSHLSVAQDGLDFPIFAEEKKRIRFRYQRAEWSWVSVTSSGSVPGRGLRPQYGLERALCRLHKPQLGWRSNIWNGPAANHFRYSRFAGLTEIANGAVSFGISYDQWIAENFRIRCRLTTERSNRRTALGVSLVRRLGRPAASARYAVQGELTNHDTALSLRVRLQ
jgi:hypothetical protein